MTLEETLKAYIETTNRMSERVDRTSETVDRMSERVDRTSETVDRLSGRIDRTSETVDRTSETVDRLSKRVDRLIERLDGYSVGADARIRALELAHERVEAEHEKTERLMRRNEREMAKLMKKSSEYDRNWGRLIEALANPSVIHLFNEKGIDVRYVDQRIVRERGSDGKRMEVDLLAINGEEIVAVEVKTTLRIEDVRYWQSKMKEFSSYFREYNDRKIYAALAFLHSRGDAEAYAMKHGFFLMKLTGKKLFTLVNDKEFIPKDFNRVA